MTEFDPLLVFDVGMHEGEDTEFYLAKGFRVVAIEASPLLCQVNRLRFKDDIEAGKLTIENRAIADASGPVVFYKNPRSVWGTIRPEWSKRNEVVFHSPSSETIMVEGALFSDIIAKYGVPYYLKIDIEGADLLCLYALQSSSSVPKYVSIESSKTSWEQLKEEFRVLKSLGYSEFKVIAQHRVQEQTLPFPSREGRYLQNFPVSNGVKWVVWRGVAWKMVD